MILDSSVNGFVELPPLGMLDVTSPIYKHGLLRLERNLHRKAYGQDAVIEDGLDELLIALSLGALLNDGLALD